MATQVKVKINIGLTFISHQGAVRHMEVEDVLDPITTDEGFVITVSIYDLNCTIVSFLLIHSPILVY